MPYFYPALPAARAYNSLTADDGAAVNHPSGPNRPVPAAACTNDAAGPLCLAAKPIAY